MDSEFNTTPYDDYTPRAPRKKGPKQTQDEHVYSQLLDKPKTQTKEQKERRARVQLQALVGDTPRDIVEPEPLVTFGEYKYRNGTWYAILQEDPEWWISGCEVRHVPTRSLPEVLRRGGRVTDAEKERIAASDVSEDPEGPILQPVPEPTITRASRPGGGLQQQTSAASRQRKMSSRKQKKPHPDAQWTPRKRARRTGHLQFADMVEDGSDIEVARPSQTQPTAGRRLRQPPSYPQ